MARKAKRGPRSRVGPGRPLRRSLIILLLAVVALPLVAVGLYKFVPPPATPLMLIRMAEGRGLDYRWRPISRISPAMVQAAIGAEDAHFCEHHGFDFNAIQKAMAHNDRRPNRIRGGSTISQQTAKNVFLWPDRSFIRKGAEAYVTVLIEGLWGKRRIMEAYLNVVELGPGIYGVQAAAQRYFHEDASQLSPSQASRLAAILPNPIKWKAVSPGPYVRKRSRRIGGAIGTVRNDGLAACVGRISRVSTTDLPELE
jgi:monofunctional biosynthetic peptidoglycan transglycosylase